MQLRRPFSPKTHERFNLRGTERVEYDEAISSRPGGAQSTTNRIDREKKGEQEAQGTLEITEPLAGIERGEGMWRSGSLTGGPGSATGLLPPGGTTHRSRLERGRRRAGFEPSGGGSAPTGVRNCGTRLASHRATTPTAGLGFVRLTRWTPAPRHGQVGPW